MQLATPFLKQWRLIVAASLVAAVIIVITMLATGTTAWAQSNPQRAAVTGLSATPGSNPGEIDVSWDAHPAGAKDYRVAWKPVGGSFRRPGNTNWNAKPTATGMTITGLTEGSEYKVKVRARFGQQPQVPLEQRGNRHRDRGTPAHPDAGADPGAHAAPSDRHAALSDRHAAPSDPRAAGLRRRPRHRARALRVGHLDPTLCDRLQRGRRRQSEGLLRFLAGREH